MKIKKFSSRHVWLKFIKCLRDDRGSAMAEYLLISGIMIPLAAYLFHPDGGYYQELRMEYNVTTTLLMYPGP